MIYYLPLECTDARYTVALDQDIVAYLNKSGKQYIRIYPEVDGDPTPPEGMFLNAPYTCQFKASQVALLCAMYKNGAVKTGDIIFTSDIWHHGLAESIAYMNYFCKVQPELRGLLHAGSFTDTDFVRDLERWASLYENMIFDIASKIYVGSKFIAKDVCKKRVIDPTKVEVTGLPIDLKRLDKYKKPADQPRKQVVVFSARNVDEKQPWLFDQLKAKLSKEFPEALFINTLQVGFTKEELYELFSVASVVVSFALQENFGYSVLEASYLGCTPIVPNRLVYPEFYSEECLYSNFEECVSLAAKVLRKKATIKNTVKNWQLSDPECVIPKWFS